MTKLFDATCVSTSREPGEKPAKYSSTTTLASRAAIPKALVNLTLTTQSRCRGCGNASAAWTLQSPSCKTEKGMRVRKTGTELSRRAGRGGIEE
jgi:hypothetical protein